MTLFLYQGSVFIRFPMDFAKKEYQLKMIASKRLIGNLKFSPGHHSFFFEKYTY